MESVIVVDVGKGIGVAVVLGVGDAVRVGVVDTVTVGVVDVDEHATMHAVTATKTSARSKANRPAF